MGRALRWKPARPWPWRVCPSSSCPETHADSAASRRSRTLSILRQLASLKPLGQIRESFILAVNGEGLWIIDQHVAHERVLFEKVLKQTGSAES